MSCDYIMTFDSFEMDHMDYRLKLGYLTKKLVILYVCSGIVFSITKFTLLVLPFIVFYCVVVSGVGV